MMYFTIAILLAVLLHFYCYLENFDISYLLLLHFFCFSIFFIAIFKHIPIHEIQISTGYCDRNGFQAEGWKVILISNHENAALGGFIKGYMFLQSSITPLNLNFLSQFFCSGAICFHIEINK